MKFMFSFSYEPENRDTVLKRFVETGGAPPEGVTMLGRWAAVDGNAGWVLCESSDAKAIGAWVLAWSDLLDFSVTAVLEDEENLEIIGALDL